MKLRTSILSALLLAFVFFAKAQTENPVKWSYAATKKGDKMYQVVLTAALPKPWHIYSQSTPDGGPRPTKISFQKNPLLVAEGAIKENGALKTTHDPNFGVDVKYYADKVEFVQLIKLKSAAKTNVSGTIEYMVCNDEKCLPPTKQSFDIKLQ